MIIKIDDSLTRLANLANRPVEEFSEMLAKALNEYHIVDDLTDNYGYKIKECYDEDAPVMAAVEALQSMGIERVTDRIYDDLMQCTIMGLGDCPICGGNMELKDGEYKRIRTTDYDSEPEYITIWETYECNVCGHKETNEC